MRRFCRCYAGIHKIVWTDIKFPIGAYAVDIQVDDNVRLEIFNSKFKAQTLDVKGFGVERVNGMQTFALSSRKEHTISILGADSWQINLCRQSNGTCHQY